MRTASAACDPARDGFAAGYNDELHHRPEDVWGRHYGDRPAAFRAGYASGRAARRAEARLPRNRDIIDLDWI